MGASRDICPKRPARFCIVFKHSAMMPGESPRALSSSRSVAAACKCMEENIYRAGQRFAWQFVDEFVVCGMVGCFQALDDE